MSGDGLGGAGDDLVHVLLLRSTVETYRSVRGPSETAPGGSDA